MKLALVFVVALLAAVYGIWHFKTREAANAEQHARVLRLDPRKVEPSTRALLLFETIPHLRDAERGVAVKQLRDALQAVPRGLLVHRPSFEVETLRFSGDGRSMLWYGKPAADGHITIEKSFNHPPTVVRTTGASYATFLNEAGTRILTGDPDRRKGNSGRELRGILSSDGGYLAFVRDDLLSLWRVEAPDDPVTFMADLPAGTTQVHCVRPAALCALESPGRFTLIDVKKRRIVRSISVNRNGAVRMSLSGRLAGVAAPRAGITIHAAQQGRTIRLDPSSSLALEDFAFSADEKSVVAVDRDGVLHSYDAATGKPLARSPRLRHEQGKSPARVEAVSDGRFVVWYADQVRLVSADLSTVTASFDDGGEVLLVKTNARGDRLAIARRTGPLTLWDIAAKPALPFIESELFDSVCDHVGRTLTAGEWAAYIPNRPYGPRCP